MEKTVLIVDDDRSERRVISKILRESLSYACREADNGQEALEILESHDDIVLIILDIDMPIMDGLKALNIIKQRYADIPVIMLTGLDDTKRIVEAMKLGATDFLSKPIENARLDVSARNALKLSIMGQEISRLKRQADNVMGFADLIGFNKGLRNEVQMGHKAALCALPVLITGETGTGKEVFARAIHGESDRAGAPFIAVNCGALPENLVESILFGHEKGSFTGALHKTDGKFLEAHGGTIFLDEIGELPLDAQVKLLRVLQQGEIEPVGAGQSTKIDVRILSATNRELSLEVKEKRFREDLFFRLNVLHIALPPLRVRGDDIEFLASYFMKQFCATHQSFPKKISASGLDKLRTHTWPGNVRELENVINRAMALCDEDCLEAKDFSFIKADIDEQAPQAEGLISPTHLDGRFKTYRDFELEFITLALKYHGHNISKTARVLGIAKSTLYKKMEEASHLSQ